MFPVQRFVFGFPALLVCSLALGVASAQTYSLSGKVTDTATHAVPSATVSAKNAANGKVYITKTNADADYTIPDLAAGDYRVWAKAGDLRARAVKVTLAAGEMTNLVVSPALHSAPRK